MNAMRLRATWLLAVMALATARSVAQDREAGEAEPPPPAREESEQAPSAPDPDPDTAPAPDEGFIPTEEILADEEVTFPIDI